MDEDELEVYMYGSSSTLLELNRHNVYSVYFTMYYDYQHTVFFLCRLQ